MGNLNLNFKFRNVEQELFFWHKERNGHFGGGFGNGKSYVACQRAFVHLASFSNYGIVIARQTFKRLRGTTMKTFFKICPKEFVYRHDENQGYTVLVNKSFIFWLHLDTADEQDLRGLETNSVLIDQGEEVGEGIANVLDARVGRWDLAKVPPHLLLSKVTNEDVRKEVIRYQNENARKNADRIEALLFTYSEWPKDAFGERFLVPNYFDVLSNPSEEDEQHWIWRNYNEESPERIPRELVFNIERKTMDELNDKATIARILTRDQEFIDKYYYGKTGSPKAIIHKIHDLSIIRPSAYDREIFEEFIRKLLRKGALFRNLDHGETGITACGWKATLKNVHIFYREYYQQGKNISYHRKAITELGQIGKSVYGIEEEYEGDFADPQIFKKVAQKNGSFYTVAEEYSDDMEIDAPPIYWSPADNNEYATRNRINELLQLSPRFSHPITGESPAPGMYFIEADGDIYPSGIIQGIAQTKAQKRILLGAVNGKNIFSEERSERVVDHAYDYVRYGIAGHSIGVGEMGRPVPKRSFAYFNALLKRNPGFVPASGKDKW